MIRTRAILGVIAVAATAAVLAGCGNSGNTAASASNTPPPAPSQAATSATTSVSGSATPAKETNGSTSITAELTHQQAVGSEILTITNKGSRPLTINGSPEFTFFSADNGKLPVPVQKVNMPGAASPITLQAGQSAFAGVKLVIGDKASDSTYVATTTKVTVPGAAPVVVSLIGDDGKPAGYPELALKSVQVGTFQPAMQGVSPDSW
jgi:uncharacterized protein DUF4232